MKSMFLAAYELAQCVVTEFGVAGEFVHVAVKGSDDLAAARGLPGKTRKVVNGVWD